MPNFRSFSDELQKIAALNVGALAGRAGGAARTAGKGFAKEFWQGSKLDKGLALVGAAGSAAEAIPENDPRGQGRGRGERLLGAVGGTLGGTYGTVLGRHMSGGKGWKGFAGSMIGGIGGGLVGEKMLTTPLRRPRQDARARQGALARKQQEQQTAGMPGSGVTE